MLLVLGLLELFSSGLDTGLGLIVVAVASFGVVVGVAIVLIGRVSPSGAVEPRETRREATWRWFQAAFMGVTIAAAVFAGFPLLYVFVWVGLLALIFTAVEVILAVRATRQLNGKSGESKAP